MTVEQMLRDEIARIQRECRLEGTPDMFRVSEGARLVPDATSLGSTYRYGPGGGTCFNGPESGCGYMFQVRTPGGRRLLHVREDLAYIES